MSDYLGYRHQQEFPRGIVQDELLSRICVSPPYFALKNVVRMGERLVAEAVAELPQGYALGPMRPGDLSRHGAIAGLCALALKQVDSKRRYYLANSAVFTGYPSQAPYGSTLRFEADVTEFGKRNARAFITAYHDQERVATLDVRYTIMTVVLFERLYFLKQRPTPWSSFKALPIGNIVWHGNTGVSQISAVPLELCAGHFEHFPAAPVALLMDQLAQIAERFVERPCYIASGQIEATRLCWAGDEVNLSMTKVAGDLRTTQLQGAIASKDTMVGEMHLTLKH